MVSRELVFKLTQSNVRIYLTWTYRRETVADLPLWRSSEAQRSHVVQRCRLLSTPENIDQQAEGEREHKTRKPKTNLMTGSNKSMVVVSVCWLFMNAEVRSWLSRCSWFCMRREHVRWTSEQSSNRCRRQEGSRSKTLAT